MSKSGQLRVEDVKSVFRLLLDCHSLNHDPLQCQQHMVTELCKLLGARQGAAFQFSNFLPDKTPKLTGLVPAGWPDAKYVNVWKDYTLKAHYLDDPMVRTLVPRRESTVTLTRQQVVSNKEWHQHSLFQKYFEPAQLYDLSACFFRLRDPDKIFGISIHRSQEDGAFKARDMAKVRLFIEEYHRLYQRGGITYLDSSTFSGLSPRQEQLLTRMLAGQHPKGIAHELGLSVHTVRTYIRDLYRRLGVIRIPKSNGLFWHSGCLV